MTARHSRPMRAQRCWTSRRSRRPTTGWGCACSSRARSPKATAANFASPMSAGTRRSACVAACRSPECARGDAASTTVFLASNLPQHAHARSEVDMPQGSKEAYTDKQKREAQHIEKSYEDKGVSKKEAESRAWATVNKQDGGGKKSGSGRKDH